MKTLLLTILLAVSCLTGYSQTTNSGTIGGSNGWYSFIGSALNFLAPNPTNGLFNADEFDVTTYGVLRDDRFGGGIAVSYWFNTGIGSSLRIDAFENDVTFTEVSMVARTTFGPISPYLGLGASHDTSGGDGEFQATSTVGFMYHLPIKKVNSRIFVELSGRGEDKPTIRFGLNFAWMKK